MLTFLLQETTSTDSISTLLDAASKLTLTAALLIAVVAFVRGWIIPPSTLADWKERAKYEQDRGDRLELALKDSTAKIESNTQAIVALKDVLPTLISRG